MTPPAWFTDDYLKFFKDLAKNNNKEWFDVNRKRYETHVKKPFEVFTAEVIKRIGKVDPAVRIVAKDAIFRINKDVRFSKDKAPYKLSCSANVSPAGRKDHSTPGLYFELGPDGVQIIGGVYMPEKYQLEKIRRTIVKDGKGLHKVIDAKVFKAAFVTVLGEVNKVLLPEFKDAAQTERLVANKQFYVIARLPASTITSRELLGEIMHLHAALLPFNRWMAKAMSE